MAHHRSHGRRMWSRRRLPIASSVRASKRPGAAACVAEQPPSPKPTWLPLLTSSRSDGPLGAASAYATAPPGDEDHVDGLRPPISSPRESVVADVCFARLDVAELKIQLAT